MPYKLISHFFDFMSPCCYSWRAHRPLKQHYLKHYSKLPLLWSISDFPRYYHPTLVCSKAWLINYPLNSQMWLTVMPVGRNTKCCSVGLEMSNGHIPKVNLWCSFWPPCRTFCIIQIALVRQTEFHILDLSQPSNVSTFLHIILLGLQVPWLNRWELWCLLVCCSLRCRFYFNTTSLKVWTPMAQALGDVCRNKSSIGPWREMQPNQGEVWERSGKDVWAQKRWCVVKSWQWRLSLLQTTVFPPLLWFCEKFRFQIKYQITLMR